MHLVRKALFHPLLVFLAGIVSTSLVPATSAWSQATPESLRLPDGFQAEMVYRVPKEQGSWVNITSDPRGRLIAADQYGKLYRVTPSVAETATKVEPIELKIGRAQGLLCAFNRLYVVAHAGGGQPAGLYCLRDKDFDDQYDSVELLREFQGGGEHGPHAVILGPDNKSLYICAGNNTALPDLKYSLVPQVWEEDQLLPRIPDANGHNVKAMAPGGWVCKTDRTGKDFVLVSMGYRNHFDIAFDPNGELFTYDADMEWDFGLPWYRPTRVCHVIPGSEYGWRNGSGKWPDFYADSLPSVVDIGPGSPTGVTFGTNARFPARYQNAFFIADWSYGIIYAVHLQPDGSTYSGTPEIFCSAPALPVTDMTINKSDGAMYFLVGGRKSQSAMYRITYNGSDSVSRAKYPTLTELARKRIELQRRQEMSSPTDPDQLLGQPDYLRPVFKSLASEDRQIRFVARSILERVRGKYWKSLATDATDVQTRLEALTGLIRTHKKTGITSEEIFDGLKVVDWDKLSSFQKLHLIRNYGLALIRLGEPSEQSLSIVRRLDQHFPVSDGVEQASELNMELARLLVVAGEPSATAKVVGLLDSSPAHVQQIHYAMVLSVAKTGWTKELREKYFGWYLNATDAYGGNSFGGYVDFIRKRAIENMTDQEKSELQELLAKKPKQKDPYALLKARPLVKNWKMDDFADLEQVDFSTRDLENGKQLFGIAQCYKCHRIKGQGGIAGPDLTPAGRRFSSHDLLEAIIDPDKAISDQYQATLFQMADGEIISGRVVNLNGNQYWVQPDMIKPNNMRRLKVDEIDEMKPSSISVMPGGLLDNLTREEILDLMAYLKSVGERAEP